MKRILCILAIAFWASSHLFGQWSPRASGVTVPLTDAIMTDSSTAIVIGYGGTILKTTDTGLHWKAKQSGTLSDLDAIAFRSSLDGYVVGRQIVCHTTDGGETWDTMRVAGNYVSVAYGGYPIAPPIFMGTDDGRIRYSYNSGNTWDEKVLSGTRIVSIANQPGPLNGTTTLIASEDSVYQTFSALQWQTTSLRRRSWDEIVGGDLRWTTRYLVGAGGNPGDFPFVLRTSSTDTGWQRLEGGLPFPSILSDVKAFPDTPLVYICGSKGGIFRSTDRGDTWIQQVTGTQRLLSGLSFYSPDRGVAVGDSGMILFTLNGGLTSVESGHGGDTPARFQLFQNYPNPFNPTTKIQFTIVNRQLTIVKVFDVLGRDVATLVSEVRDPGTYAVEFDASALSSGVYFYRVQAGDFVAVKKLLVLR